MARIRSLKPELYEDEALGGCSVSARYLFVGLISHSDDEGRQRGAPKLIMANVFPYDDYLDRAELEGWLAELERERLVILYEVGSQRFIQIRNWCKHQRVDHPRPSGHPSPSEPAISGAPEGDGNNPASLAPEGNGVEEDKDEEGNAGASADASARDLDLLRWHAELWGSKKESGWGPKQLASARWLLANVDDTLLVAVLRWAKKHRFWSGRAANINRVRDDWTGLKAQYDAEGGSPQASAGQRMATLEGLKEPE